MWTQIYWVDGPWPGKLAIAARPRGGDWLADEMADWRQAGIDMLLSLLTADEAQDLDLQNEANEAEEHGMAFASFPIPDRHVPRSEAEAAEVLAKLDRDLQSGKNVLVHCRQGIGRSGLIAACLLAGKGLDPETAVAKVSAARGTTVPETAEQVRWIDHYAALATGID